MHIKRIHEMMEKVTECANSQFSKGIDSVDTEEMSKVVDMIKDLACAEKDALISKAMYESEADETMDMYDYYENDRRYYDDYRYKRTGRFAPKGKGSYMPRRGYSEPYYHMTPEMYRNMPWDDIYNIGRDLDRDRGRMYYTENGNMQNGTNNGMNNRDSREGRSGRSRVKYYETKMTHGSNSPEDKNAKMHELENYAKELTEDVTDMVADMSNEEKTLLKQKLSLLVQKI